MTTEHLTDESLQRHFDAELEAGERAHAHAHMAACSDCARRFDALLRLHRLLSMAAEHNAADVSFDGMFERIEAGIAGAQDARAADKRPARVVTLANYRRIMPAFAAVAVAAAVLLMVAVPRTAERDDKGRVGATPDRESEGAATPAAHAAAGRSEIVQVDFGGNAGTVFEIALADGSSTPVVWINDE